MEEEIIKGNVIIAEFMGEEITPDGKWQSKHNGVMDFRYDSSWDWIMPVIEKIEQITLKEIIGVAASKPYWENDKLRVAVGSNISKQGFKEVVDFPVCFTINGRESWIQYYFTNIGGGDSHFDFIRKSGKSKIESTWNAIVGFIKIYNEKNNTPSS